MPRAALTGRRRVSGEVVISKVSGEAVKVSGEVVSLSGQRVILSGLDVVTTVAVSGEVASLSGQAELFSGLAVQMSGETVIAKVSGELVSISGEIVAKVSGEVVSLSGQRVILSGLDVVTTVAVSGEVASLSGQAELFSGLAVSVSGNVVKISGQVVDLKAPTAIKTSGLFTVTGASGGANLYSGSVVSVTVKALSGNSGDIFIGGSGYKPYSGYGFLLEAGEAINLDVDNFGEVWAVATVSGDKVTYLGIA